MRSFLLSLSAIFFFVLTGSRLLLADSIAYTQFTDDYWQVWTKEIDGDAKQVTNSPFDKRSPVWSPDGTQIIYRSANREIYMFDLTTKAEKRILSELGALTDPILTPDSKQLLFTRFDSNLKDESDLWIVDLDNQEKTVLTHSPGLEHSADISPDGIQVIYVGGKGSGNHELYLLTLQDKKTARLTENQALELSPRFSPDGKWIIFSSDEGGNFDIYVMNKSGRSKKKLTDWAGVDLSPAWSPDGRQIAFASDRSGVMQVWVMDADGKNPHPLLEGTEASQEPVWR